MKHSEYTKIFDLDQAGSARKSDAFSLALGMDLFGGHLPHPEDGQAKNLVIVTTEIEWNENEVEELLAEDPKTELQVP